jgi:hypothetical protein
MAQKKYPSIKQIIKTSVTVATGGGSISLFSPPVSDINKTILLSTFWNVSNNNFNRYASPSIGLVHNSGFVIDTNAASNISANVCILEFEQGVKVQHLNISGGANTITVPIDPVDLKSSFIIPSCVGSGTGFTYGSLATYELTPSSVIASTYSGPTIGRIQVVQWDGAYVQSYHGSSNLADSINLSKSVDLTRSLLFYSTRASGSLAPSSTQYTQFYLNDANTIKRIGPSSVTDNGRTSLYLVELPQMFVQQGNIYLGSSLSGVTTIPTPVRESRSFMFGQNTSSWIMNSGLVSGTPYNNGNATQIRPYPLTSDLLSSGYSFSRTSGVAGTSGYYFWQVFEYQEDVRVKRIQSGETNLATGMASTSVTIDAVDRTKSLLLYSARTSSSEPNELETGGLITADTTLTFYSTAGVRDETSTLAWQVIEFESGVRVQSGTATPSTSTTDITIQSIDTTKAIPLIFSVSAGSITNADDVVSFEFINSTTLRINCVSVPNTIYWQVVEFHNATIQKFSGSSTSTTTDIPITPIDMNKSFTITGWTINAAFGFNNTFISYLTSDSNLRLQRGGGTTSLNYITYVITLPKIHVEHASLDLTSTSGIYNTASKFDSSKTAILIGGWRNSSALSTTTTSDGDDAFITASMLSNTEVLIRRNGTYDGSTAHLDLIEFDHDEADNRYRSCALTVNPAAISGDLSSFPVYLKWDGSQSTSNLPEEMFVSSGAWPAQHDGGDIIIASDEEGVNRLPLEIVNFNTATSASGSYAEIHTSVDSLLSGSGTNIYLFWNKNISGGTNHSSGWSYQPSNYLQYGQYNVWDTGYLGVWHYSETSGTQLIDSTVNAINGSYSGNLPSPINNGKVGFAQGLNGGSNFISFADRSEFDVSQYTFEGWVQSNASTENSIAMQSISSSLRLFYLYSLNTSLYYKGGWFDELRITSYTQDEWNHFSVIGVSSQRSNIIYNGSTFLQDTAVDPIDNPNANLYLGYYDPGGTYRYSGLFDEFRLSSIERSTEWRKASYLNQQSPETFITVGTPYNINGGSGVISGLLFDPWFYGQYFMDMYAGN